MTDAVRRFRYHEHPAVAHEAAILRNLRQKTGRSLEQWLTSGRAQGHADEKAARAWFAAQGAGSVASWSLASRLFGRDPLGEAPHAHIEAQYAGKPHLIPVYEALVELVLSLGPDIRLCPCKGYLPIYRAHVIAQIKPTTKTRIDLGLALGEASAGGRLIDTGGYAKKDRITHRIALGSMQDLDAEAASWLRAAYERDG